MLDNFLKETELSFEEYSEWFLSLKKGDEVLRYQLRKLSYIVREASSTGIELESDFGLYQLKKNDIVYFVSARNFFKAEHFPIPSEKQIELIKQKRQSKKENLMPTELEKESDISSEITQLFESCQKKASEFAKSCDDEKYRLATENDALKLTIEQLNKQLKDLEEKCKDRENRVSFLCVALKDEQDQLAKEHAHHMETCSLKDEIEEENSKLAEENKQLKQKLDQLKSFLEPDHK